MLPSCSSIILKNSPRRSSSIAVGSAPTSLNNSNPSDADYVIPSNDDAIRAVKLCVEKIANACQEGRHIFMQKVQSGELTAEKVEESDYVVERKAFVFKSNTQDPEQDSVVYAEDENQEKQDS